MDEAKVFFVLHLMENYGMGSIRDLSWQFGARGFTEEMRQAVGGTQRGLSAFLAKFPSTFELAGDKVFLKRDYVADTVQYFSETLEKHGPELLIEGLIGHRGQADPVIRHISGRNMREFTDFLTAHPNVFVVEGDRVRLKNIVESKESVEVDEDGNPLAGERAKKAAIDYLKGLLEQDDGVAIPIEIFHRKFCERFPHSVRQEVGATNPKEFRCFLKKNRHIFPILSNKVSLAVPNSGQGNENGGAESGPQSSTTENVAGSVETSGREEGAKSGEGSRPLSNVSSSAGERGLFPLTREGIPLISLVKDVQTAEGVVRDFLTELEGQPQEERIVALDFKMSHLDEGNLPSMIIMASNVKLACFDMAHGDGILPESGLKELIFESPKITKVIHGVKAISGLLAERFSVKLQNVFDTQVAHAVIQHEHDGTPFSELCDVSFSNLQRIYHHSESLMLASDTGSDRNLSQSQSCWGQRPITDELLLSACEQAHSLVSVLYRTVLAQLPMGSQALFEGKCLEALSPIQPLSANGDDDVEPPAKKKKLVSMATQTLSTGEITVHKTYNDDVPEVLPCTSNLVIPASSDSEMDSDEDGKKKGKTTVGKLLSCLPLTIKGKKKRKRDK